MICGDLISFHFRFFGSSDLTNFLLWHTVAGSGAYIYTRKHLKKSTCSKRIAYAWVSIRSAPVIIQRFILYWKSLANSRLSFCFLILALPAEFFSASDQSSCGHFWKIFSPRTMAWRPLPASSVASKWFDSRLTTWMKLMRKFLKSISHLHDQIIFFLNG